MCGDGAVVRKKCNFVKNLTEMNIRKSIFAAALGIGLQSMALTGSWRGDLDLGATRLPLVFNFSVESGVQRCTMDSPMQGAKGIAVRVAFCTSDSVSLSIANLGVTFTGSVTPAVISGTFRQMGHSLPLTLVPERPIGERRPQTPKPPFPYNEIDTVFASSDGTLLSATLVVPVDASSRCKPAVVMVTGSGPQNRDEEVFDHRPFAVIADALARRGIASLRYDDRGVGRSQGSYAESDINDFTADASGALNFLRGIPQIGKAGVLGHSEGGTIALRLGADAQPDFVVSLAGAAEKGKDIILDQNRQSLEKTGIDPTQRDAVLKLLSAVFDDIAAGNKIGEKDIDSLVAQFGVAPEFVPMLKQNVPSGQSEYMRQLISLNPSEWLCRVNCPVLALNGMKDTQVNSDRNLAIISSNVNGAKTISYPGLNHLFQPATTGEMSEYESIATTIAPQVLEDIADFILSQE